MPREASAQVGSPGFNKSFVEDFASPGRSPGDPQSDSNRLNLNRAVEAAFVIELTATYR